MSLPILEALYYADYFVLRLHSLQMQIIIVSIIVPNKTKVIIASYCSLSSFGIDLFYS